MEENENKKNARIFYLTLAVIMTAVIVLVIATTVARRNLPDNDINTNDTNSSLNNDQQTGIEDPEDQIPEFTMPVSGELSVDFSDSIPVFSQTMNDYRTHLGVDLSAPLGTEVVAVADGVITNVWNDPFMGTCVSIEHTGNAISVYKNLDPTVKDGIVIGTSVKSGDVIGAVGESAMNEIAEEPHLHYELKVDGKHVDPKPFFKFFGKGEENKEPSTEGENNTENQ